MNLFLTIALVILLPKATLSGPAGNYDLNLAPDSGLVANTAIDIIEHNGGIWMATGKGLVHSFDGGLTWLVYDDANGLISDDISSLFSIDGRLWVATNRAEIIGDRLESISDGISFSDDNGLTWTQIDFGPSGLNIPFILGGNQTVFDITGHTDLDFADQPGVINDWLFFGAFAGGLLASLDGGASWRRIFPSVNDSIQYEDPGVPSLRNRYFSAVVDTSHGDSLFLWTGTASGVFQYIFAPPGERLFSRVVNDILFCDICSGTAGGRVYYGGENGLSFSNSDGSVFRTRFEDEGLPGRSITSMFDIGGRLLVGTRDPILGLSTGLAVSNDAATSFQPIALAEVTGAGGEVRDFNLVGNQLYMAGAAAGLFASSDTGSTWAKLLVDSINLTSGFNMTHSLASFGDTLYVGTDSGFVALYLSATATIDSLMPVPFPLTDSTSTKIIKLKVQPYVSDTISGIPDSVALWAISRPLTTVGQAAVYRSVDRGATWRVLQSAVSHDIGFIGDIALVVGELAIRMSIGGSNANQVFSAKEFISGGIEVANLDNDTVTAIAVRGDTIVFGTRRGMAVSVDRGASFKITRPNLDSLRANAVVNFTALNTFDGITQEFGLSGDFVPSLAVQHLSAGVSRIWASGRAVDFGGDGISAASFVPVVDTLGDTSIVIDWETVYFDGFAWNFSFAGDSIFASTNGGLLLNRGDFTNQNQFVWDTVQLVDTSGTRLIDANTAVFAVSVIGDTLWLGTDDGTISIDLTNPVDQRLYQVVDSSTTADEVYSYPLPFSGRRGEKVDFHFVIGQPGNVTLSVYDFAMNLVATPIDNQFFAAGIYPTGSSQGATWDGRNGNGEFVAVGMYYFKVEQSGGNTRWGKVAVIP